MLAPVAGGCNDDNGVECGGNRASVRFQGIRGVSYRILVGGYGGARGVLNVFADYPSLSSKIYISGGTGSDVLLQGRGAPRTTYVMQISSDLLNWVDLTPVTTEADGRFDLAHTNNFPARFFRLRSQ